VHTLLKNPWWRKPDWAFIEEGEPLPKDESERLDPEMLGEYAIGFGDGFYIHGTIYERLLGVSVTHGCVRLNTEDLRKLYRRTRIGTYIFVY
jgi:L,D-transpeptidase YbiS